MGRALSNVCEHEAERIQYWLEKDKDSLFSALIRTSNPSEQPFSRKCDRITIAKVPPQNTLSGKKKLSGVKKNPINLNLLKKRLSSISKKSAFHPHCSINQKGAYLLAKEKTDPQLSSERVVKTWELKGHFYAFKKIKSLATQPKGRGREHHIVTLSSSKKKHPSTENQELWEEIILSKENRLFQIGRGVKILSE